MSIPTMPPEVPAIAQLIARMAGMNGARACVARGLVPLGNPRVFVSWVEAFAAYIAADTPPDHGGAEPATAGPAHYANAMDRPFTDRTATLEAAITIAVPGKDGLEQILDYARELETYLAKGLPTDLAAQP